MIYRIILFLNIILGLSFGSLTGSVLAQDTASANTMTLTSSAFLNEAAIPDRYTCKGGDLNPPLSITGIPEGTKSLALIVFDPHGVVGPWVHWVVFNIPPETTEIVENSVPGVQALNDFGNFYYGGPCLADQKVHRFVFTVYALSAVLTDVTEGATKDTLEKAMVGKILAKAELAGTYQNLNWE